MKVTAIAAREFGNGERLDARYFTVPAQRFRRTLASAEGVVLQKLGGESGLAHVSAPARFKRAYAASGEQSVPYLRPYDVFEYLPGSADLLSVGRTENLDEYMIRPGDILQTCSGRNLGPVTLADQYVAKFALSHDMIRVRIGDERLRHYVLAFMRTQIGQHLLRGDLSGTVIDHITVDHVSQLAVPIFPDLVDIVSSEVKRAHELRESARLTLSKVLEVLERALDEIDVVPTTGASPRIWTTRARAFGTRLDAAFHDDLVRQTREGLRRRDGIRLGDVAEVLKPGGRYKTYYVEAGFGHPLLSGRQLLQMDVIGGKWISERSVPTDVGYELRTGQICFQADGRAEEGLGTPVLITSERDGWMASGHVGRVIPLDKRDAGWLWASMAVSQVQSQVAALACGSVVDALYPEDLGGLLLPPREFVDGQAVMEAWAKFALAAELESDALSRLGTRLELISGLAA